MGPVATSQLLGPEALPGFHVTAQIRKLKPNVARWLVEDQGGPCQPDSGHQAPSPSRAWLTSLPQVQAVVTEGHRRTEPRGCLTHWDKSMRSQLNTKVMGNERAGQGSQGNAPDMSCRTCFLAMEDHGIYKEKTCFSMHAKNNHESRASRGHRSSSRAFFGCHSQVIWLCGHTEVTLIHSFLLCLPTKRGPATSLLLSSFPGPSSCQACKEGTSEATCGAPWRHSDLCPAELLACGKKPFSWQAARSCSLNLLCSAPVPGAGLTDRGSATSLSPEASACKSCDILPTLSRNSHRRRTHSNLIPFFFFFS